MDPIIERMIEQQVVDLLRATLQSDAAVRTDAELHLELLYNNPAFPNALISLASLRGASVDLRQASLLTLKKLVLKRWSPLLEEYEGPIQVDDVAKEQIRHALLTIATSGDSERKVVAAASYVVSKIASADFPEAWPSLLSTLLQLVPHSDHARLHGVLVVLGNLVEDGFDEEQFSESAVALVRCLYQVATDATKKLTARAMAVSIFRACFDTMELVYQTNKATVKQFMQESSDAWLPLFVEVLSIPLPSMPSEEEEALGGEGVVSWRGVIALKTQVVKALDKIHGMFPSLLNAHNQKLFTAIWGGLAAHVVPYHELYVVDSRQGRLEDADRLPYTLDFLVIEELDYIQTLLNISMVQRGLEAQLAPSTVTNGEYQNTWIAQALPVLVGFAQITTEDEGMWDIDINVFLSEETSETANYSVRDACSNFARKLCSMPVQTSVFSYCKTVFDDRTSSPKTKEAMLYILKQVLDETDSLVGKDSGDEVKNLNQSMNADTVRLLMDYVSLAMQDGYNFLRARGYIVAGALTTTAGDYMSGIIPDLAQRTLHAIENDPSEVVKVACIRVMQEYLKALPASRAREFQVQTVGAISGFLSTQDLDDMEESPDLLDTLVETLRDAIMADPSLCLEHPALDLLFSMAKYGVCSWQTTLLVNEAFESITSSMASKGADAYGRLCAKVLPMLMGALDVGDLTSVNALSEMAVSLLCSLAENGPEPLPPGFVAAVMPKLYRLLFSQGEFSLHQTTTLTIKHILAHDPVQTFDWRDSETGKGGLEVILLIIDRLLGPEVDDASAAEVGGLAVELVQKAGPERLGPYLMQLLRVVAIRLSTADHASFVQNLVLVFARLALTNPREVVDFLAQVEVNVKDLGIASGLEVVLVKWLENSANFSGYDAIRQNVFALTNIYKLHDERLNNIQVQGDLIVPNTSRIKTRSQAKREPDQWTVITVPLKLVKVLIQELVISTSPTTMGRGLIGTRNETTSDDEDDGWEDEPPVLDLGLAQTRSELMSFADESRWHRRQADDETQKYLVQFFHSVESEANFQALYHALTDAEREKLQKMDNA